MRWNVNVDHDHILWLKVIICLQCTRQCVPDTPVAQGAELGHGLQFLTGAQVALEALSPKGVLQGLELPIHHC